MPRGNWPTSDPSRDGDGISSTDRETAERWITARPPPKLLVAKTRRLLADLEAYVATRAEAEGTLAVEVHFTRRQLREALKWGDTQLKVHINRLVDLAAIQLDRRDHLVANRHATQHSHEPCGNTVQQEYCAMKWLPRTQGLDLDTRK